MRSKKYGNVFEKFSMVMAILQSCCCWQSVRKGSYASAFYTMSYFLLTCFIMGVTIHHDMEYYWTRNNVTNTKPKNASFLEPVEISPVTMFYYLVVFLLSAFGVFTAMLLIVGLYFEKRLLLLPWMSIVLVSSFVDVTHSIYWLTLDDPSFNPLTAIFFTIELFVFLLNIYSLLCVFSQYQEYKAGRGTAAYDTLLETIRRNEQTPSISIRCSQQHATGTSYLTGTVSHSTRDFGAAPIDDSPNTAIIMDNIKSRRVQFTADMESQATTKLHATGLLVPNDQGRNLRISQVEEEDDDYENGRSDFLWCAAPDEHILICDLPSSHHPCQDSQPSKKRISISESSKSDVEKSSRKK